MSEKYKSRIEKRKASQKKKQKKPSSKGLFKKIFLALLVIGFLTLIGGIATFAFMVSDAPEFDPEKLKDPVSSKIYDMNNQLIEELGTEKRDLVEFDEIPEQLKNAILATEDVRFFDHSGIDVIRLGGAVIGNITDGFGSQGGSTLTQQVVKLSFLSNEKTLKRKAHEAWLSFQMEQAFSKEQIFEMYVNKVPMGGNVYGIKAAAKTYFNKDLDELTLPEVALIAGLPQRPNAYNPFVNPDLANERKNTVLYLMNRHGFISEQEMKEAQGTDIETLLAKAEKGNEEDDAPFDSFIDQIIDEVEKLGYNVYTDGLEIYTTIDQSAQKRVHDLLNSEGLFPDDELQAGIILLDTKTGEIRAIGGGRHQKVKRGWNYAIDSRRQPGSTIKPILDYGPAIEYLKWSTYHILVDEPYQYSDGTPVKNANNRYDGPQTMRYHLKKSRNIPAIKALQAVGIERAQAFAESLGIPFYEPVYESYAIGGFEEGFAPIHLAGAYSAFGNNGVYNKPHAIRKIVLPDGVTEIDLTPEPKSVMSDYTAFMITDMLKSVLESGTGTSARVPGVPIAGKTGTTNFENKDGSPDSWFAGYSTNYTAAIWVGYSDEGKPVPNTVLPQIIFKELMTYVHKGLDTPDFKQPASVVKLGIEKGSNPAKLASEFTPESEIVYEYFIKGHEPTEVSDKYDKVPPISDLTIDYNEKKQEVTLKWKYEKIKGIQFDVYASVEESEQEQVGSTEKLGLKIIDVVPGFTYTFTVYAVYEDKRSEPVSVPLDLSAFIIEPDPTEPPEDGNQGNDEGDEKREEEENDNDGRGGNNGNDPGESGEENGA